MQPHERDTIPTRTTTHVAEPARAAPYTGPRHIPNAPAIPNPFTPRTRAQAILLDAFAAGEPVYRIAARYGSSARTLQMLAHGLGRPSGATIERLAELVPPAAWFEAIAPNAPTPAESASTVNDVAEGELLATATSASP